MRCPTLAELPSAPPGKTGWPWTVETQLLPSARSDGNPWPRISIVTPSYNQGQFIEATIRSVLLQGYPDLEYIIIDGGSTDRSVEIITKYTPWLSYWVSELDSGQTNAINKGLKRSTGSIFNWLNTDDFLLSGTLALVAREWARETFDIFAAAARFIDALTNVPINIWKPQPPRTLGDFIPPGNVFLAQPSTFLSRVLVDDIGYFRENLNCTMDYEFYFRSFKHRGDYLRVSIVEDVASHIGVHPAAKSSRLDEIFSTEWRSVLLESATAFSSRDVLKLRKCLNEYILQTLVHSPENWDRLFIIGLQHPQLFTKRYYWGKVRRKMGRTIGMST